MATAKKTAPKKSNGTNGTKKAAEATEAEEDEDEGCTGKGNTPIRIPANIVQAAIVETGWEADDIDAMDSRMKNSLFLFWLRKQLGIKA